MKFQSRVPILLILAIIALGTGACVGQSQKEKELEATVQALQAQVAKIEVATATIAVDPTSTATPAPTSTLEPPTPTPTQQPPDPIIPSGWQTYVLPKPGVRLAYPSDWSVLGESEDFVSFLGPNMTEALVVTMAAGIKENGTADDNLSALKNTVRRLATDSAVTFAEGGTLDAPGRPLYVIGTGQDNAFLASYWVQGNKAVVIRWDSFGASGAYGKALTLVESVANSVSPR